MMKVAFAGFRHGHIMGLHQQVLGHAEARIVAACEEDEATRQALATGGKVQITHARFDEMLERVPCDAVAIGDCYGRRGRLAIAALRAGKHVISDKPICTRPDELEEITRLSAERGLRVGCLLDLRGIGALRAMRQAILEGGVGTIHTVSFSAQHPLMYGSRPSWYFEPNLHGGCINDIAVHAIDLIPWLTGRRIDRTVAARAWNARLPQHPHFQDAGQLMLQLDNGGGVLGDVSYLAPERCGYTAPQYWRLTCHGSGGVIEQAFGLDGRRVVHIASNDDAAPRLLENLPDAPDVCFEAFRRDIAGQSHADDLTTADVLEASRLALQAQQMADGAA